MYESDGGNTNGAAMSKLMLAFARHQVLGADPAEQSASNLHPIVDLWLSKETSRSGWKGSLIEPRSFDLPMHRRSSAPQEGWRAVVSATGGVPMAEQTSRTELSVMVSPRASAPQTSEGELTGVKSEKQEALPQWPFSWLTSDALRGWYNSPHLALRDSVNHPATSAPEQRLQRAGVQGGVDAVTSIDRLLHASFGRFTLGLSPAALWLAYADWAVHLCGSPGKCQLLAEKAVRKTVRLHRPSLPDSAGLRQGADSPASLPH